MLRADVNRRPNPGSVPCQIAQGDFNKHGVQALQLARSGTVLAITSEGDNCCAPKMYEGFWSVYRQHGGEEWCIDPPCGHGELERRFACGFDDMAGAGSAPAAQKGSHDSMLAFLFGQ
jgi:hypothetical protein